MTDPTNPETPEVDTGVVDTAPEADAPEIELDEDGNEKPQPEPDDTEEVEHEGAKYKIPKALKPALLMQADYTRKTQEVAEQRRLLAERQTQLQAREKQHSEFLTEAARVQSFKEAIAEYEKVNWAQLRANDPAQYDQHWFNYQQLKDRATKVETELGQKLQAKAIEEQRESARQVEEGRAVLQREIKDWSPELAAKVGTFARERFGFTPQELGQVTDPRMIKVLHAAFIGTQIQQQNQTKQAATKTAEVAAAAKPLTTVSSRSASAGVVKPTDPASDKLSTDEWARRRTEQLRKQRGH